MSTGECGASACEGCKTMGVQRVARRAWRREHGEGGTGGLCHVTLRAASGVGQAWVGAAFGYHALTLCRVDTG